MAADHSPGRIPAGTICVTLSANLAYVRPVRHLVNALCTMAHYSEDETETLALVTTEILNNSIEHGSHGSLDRIDVTIMILPDRFRFEVLDPGKGGPGFASGALARAARTPNLEDPRGRGLFLIRNFMDELKVTYEPGRGTRVVVSKARTP